MLSAMKCSLVNTVHAHYFRWLHNCQLVGASGKLHWDCSSDMVFTRFDLTICCDLDLSTLTYKIQSGHQYGHQRIFPISFINIAQAKKPVQTNGRTRWTNSPKTQCLCQHCGSGKGLDKSYYYNYYVIIILDNIAVTQQMTLVSRFADLGLNNLHEVVWKHGICDLSLWR